MRNELTPLTLVFVGLAISVHGLFLFDRRILFDKGKLKTLLIIALGLFGLHYLLEGFDVTTRNMELMQVPFMALLIFMTMNFIYFRIFREYPQDSFWTMDISLMKDGIFNFLFWVLGLIVPIYLAYKIL